MPEQWFVRREHGAVDGPFLERQIADGLAAGEIGAGQFVRQGTGGIWHEADRVRAVFQQLQETGWYVRSQDDVYGPFTEKRLLDLYATGRMELGSEIRQGTSGNWKSAEKVLQLWQNQKASTAALAGTNGGAGEHKWSTEPVRHVVMSVQAVTPAVLAELRPLERLLLEAEQPASDDVRMHVTRANGQLLGQLSDHNARQILANCDRGLTHVALASAFDDQALQIALILCPPGADAAVCRRYIDDHFGSRTVARLVNQVNSAAPH